MTSSDTHLSRGLVIGCGGTLGAAWTVAALVAVRDALGWDPRDADALVGTSAGAELVAMLGSGIGVDEILAMQLGEPTHPVLSHHLEGAPGRFPPLPRSRPSAPGLLRRAVPTMTRLSGLLPEGRGDADWLDRLATGVADSGGWVTHPRTWMVAMDAASGERVAFGAQGAPNATLSEALRASWAIPGWMPPVPIGGRRYMDGGASSTASADLLAGHGLDEVIVLAPMASRGRIPGRGPAILERLVLRNWMSAGLDAECAALEASGTRVIRIDATAEDLAVMGPTSWTTDADSAPSNTRCAAPAPRCSAPSRQEFVHERPPRGDRHRRRNLGHRRRDPAAAHRHRRRRGPREGRLARRHLA